MLDETAKPLPPLSATFPTQGPCAVQKRVFWRKKELTDLCAFQKRPKILFTNYLSEARSQNPGFGKRFDLTRDKEVHIFLDAPAAFLLKRMLQRKLAGREETVYMEMPSDAMRH